VHGGAILQLAERILKETNSSSPIIHKALPQDDPKVRCPDITLARKLLGWEPTISLDEGLKKTVPWFKSELRLESA